MRISPRSFDSTVFEDSGDKTQRGDSHQCSAFILRRMGVGRLRARPVVKFHQERQSRHRVQFLGGIAQRLVAMAGQRLDRQHLKEGMTPCQLWQSRSKISGRNDCA